MDSLKNVKPEARYCGLCQRVVAYRLMMRTTDAGLPEAYLGCTDCRAETYTPAEYDALLVTAEARLRYLDVSFGLVVSRVVALHRSWDEAYEDLALFGAPSECGALMMQKAPLEELDRIGSYGLTPAMYRRLLYYRCDGKQIHYGRFDLEAQGEMHRSIFGGAR